MQFNDLWDVIKKRNPNLSTDDTVKMTITGFKKALLTAYNEGQKEGRSLNNYNDAKGFDFINDLMNMANKK